MSESNVLCEQIIAGGWNSSRLVNSGQKISLTDVGGSSNASVM